MSIWTSLSVSSWRSAYIALGFSLAALIAMYWGTAASIVALWSKDPLAHGYIVIPAVVYLAWDRRHDLEPLSPASAFWALPLVGLLAFLWLLGSLTDTRVIQQVCLVAMFVGFVWGVLGSPAARVLLFPLGFLLFALPLGDRFIPTLQDLAARFAVKMLAFSGVPVLLQGHVISIPGGAWKVAEACSGINYLTSSLAIGYLYAGTAYRYWVHRVGFLVASALVPLVANGLRVYGTILIASLGGTEIAAGTRHYLFGWFIFATMMGLLLATCGRWREDPADGVAKPKSTGPGVPATRHWSPVLFATLGLVVVGIAPVTAKLYWRSLEPASTQFEPPTASLPWTADDRAPYSWRPRFDTPSAEFARTYRFESNFVKVYVAYYAPNQPGVKLASGNNVLFEDPWWAAGHARRTVSLEGQSFRVRETRLEGSSPSLVVWDWYWVDGSLTDSDYVAKLYLAKARLFRSSKGSAKMAVATEDRLGVDPATILQDFLHHLSITETLASRH